MNKIIVSGNICKDFESVKRGNTTITESSVAVYDGKDSDGNAKTLFFNVKLFGETGAKISQNVKKGDRVIISGRLSVNEYKGKTYVDIVAEQVERVHKKEE